MTHGRKLTTGRYETRQELVEMVLHLYYSTRMNQHQVALCCRISDTTVANILKNRR